jgi:hypothetical protein
MGGDGENRSVIVDFLVARGDTETLGALLSRTVLDAEAGGAESISVMSTQPRADSQIRAFGFLPRSESHCWVVANWKGRIPAGWLESHDPWHVRLGDSDGDFWTGGR